MIVPLKKKANPVLISGPLFPISKLTRPPWKAGSIIWSHSVWFPLYHVPTDVMAVNQRTVIYDAYTPTHCGQTTHDKYASLILSVYSLRRAGHLAGTIAF